MLSLAKMQKARSRLIMFIASIAFDQYLKQINGVIGGRFAVLKNDCKALALL